MRYRLETMYVKTTSRKLKDGTAVRYLHLAHNEWDPAAGRSVPKIAYTFGREDHLDRAAVRRLVASLSKLLDPAEALAATTPADLTFCASRPFGGTYTLDALWHRLHLDTIIHGLRTSGRGRPRDTTAIERTLFALVANRALAPSSKLAAAEWICDDVHIMGLPEVGEQECYRAMDWLHRVQATLEVEVFNQVATLFDLDVDLLFFDTTSTYFELDTPDEPIERNERGEVLIDGEPEGEPKGFRGFGHSTDHRPDLPQIVIGMAVTRSGIPVRCWCWPGATSDQTLIRQVTDDMRDWTLSKIIWVADRGFASAANRRWLRHGDHHYILAEKLRSDSAEIKAALSRQGRYTEIAGNLRIKEVKVSEHERFVICYNPEAAERDAQVRERLIAQLSELIDGSDKLSATKRAELRGRISTKPGLARFLRTTGGGLLRIDRAAIEREANLDGKFLLRSSDPRLSAADIAAGYQQLAEVERGWRTMKSVIDLRPVYHRLEERIRAHVILCWLALLLIRIIENATGQTWTTIRRELDRLHVGTFTGPAGLFRQRTELTRAQQDLFAKLAITPPKQIIELTAARR
jgi:hypothetical protein